MSTQNTPDALLFITPGCPYCPGVMQALAELVKQGAIGSLEIVNAALHPRRAEQLGVRTAPWIRIGSFILEGNQTPAQLRQWAQTAGTQEGTTRYLESLLREGKLARVEQLISGEPGMLKALLPLIAAADTPMQVRLGISAIIEGLQGQSALHALTDRLGRLSTSNDHRVRSDACYFLGLSGSASARQYLEPRLNDNHEEVREIAQEALDGLATPGER